MNERIITYNRKTLLEDILECIQDGYLPMLKDSYNQYLCPIYAYNDKEDLDIFKIQICDFILMDIEERNFSNEFIKDLIPFLQKTLLDTPFPYCTMWKDCKDTIKEVYGIKNF